MKTAGEIQEEIHYLSQFAGVGASLFRHEVIAQRTLIPATAVPSVETARDGVDLVLASGSVYAYATFNRSPGARFPGRQGLQVFDVTDPTAPVYVGTGTDPSGDYRTWDIFYPGSGDILYLHNVTSNAFQAWDISTRIAPARLGERGGFSGGIYVVGSIAYTCCTFSDRMQIYDVSNPNAITDITSALNDRTDLFPVPIFGPMSCWVVGTNLFMVNNAIIDPAYFCTIDVSVPAFPSQVNALLLGASDPNVERTDILISGSLAYVVWSTKLIIIDVSIPAAPAILSTTIVATRAARDLALNGTTLYIAIDSELARYDVSNPAAPALISTTPTLSEAFGVALNGANVVMLDSFDFGVGTGDFIEILPA